MLWENMTDQEQIYLYWEYCAANEEEPISFKEFDEMMQGFVVYTNS